MRETTIKKRNFSRAYEDINLGFCFVLGLYEYICHIIQSLIEIVGFNCVINSKVFFSHHFRTDNIFGVESTPTIYSEQMI